MNSIVVKSLPSDNGSDYVMFTIRPDRLEISYLSKAHDRLTVVHSECLRYRDYPEARAVHDGSAWNLVELMNWLITVEPSAVIFPSESLP